MLEQGLILISLRTWFLNKILDNKEEYLFLPFTCDLKNLFLNNHLFIYSANDAKAIIGYIDIDDCLIGDFNNIQDMLIIKDKNLFEQGQITNMLGNINKYYALHIKDIIIFNNSISFTSIKNMAPNFRVKNIQLILKENYPTLFNYIKDCCPEYKKSKNI